MTVRCAAAVFMRIVVLVFVVAALCSFGTAAFADENNQVNSGQLPDSSFIYETSIFDLTTSDSYYENQTVQIAGEVVGDRINAEGDDAKCWITVNALPNAQAATVQVLVSNELADKIDTYGRYNVTGSIVSIMGTYHLVCGEHEGLSDVHAESLTVTEAGKTQVDQTSFSHFVPGILLVAAGIGLLLYYRRARERLR